MFCRVIQGIQGSQGIQGIQGIQGSPCGLCMKAVSRTPIVLSHTQGGGGQEPHSSS